MKIRLFIKPHCGWCWEAKEWLDKRGVVYDLIDVIENDRVYREMQEISGQHLAPVLDVDGAVLADFGVDELEEFWHEQGLDQALG